MKEYTKLTLKINMKFRAESYRGKLVFQRKIVGPCIKIFRLIILIMEQQLVEGKNCRGCIKQIFKNAGCSKCVVKRFVCINV